ncbi:MAG: biotin--[acetyl-CoA-carboxylase] ligase [Phycisphaeraceae bacterium]|nr:MAG: biotin--[acetyl-CoA-carboxylase] ligase [Phycisphaeraceae bacterium]
MVGSTNDEARRWAAENPDAWAAVVAREQTAGRGRLGRAWASPEGGAWITLVCPAPSQGVASPAALVAGVAACSVIEQVIPGIPTPKIRWPNDLLIEGRKVGGLLGETAVIDRRPTLLLGIGVNVNNRVDDDLRTPAVNLAAHADGPVDLPAFVDALADRVSRRVAGFFGSGWTDDLSKSLNKRLADRGRRVRLEGAGEPIAGVLIGVGAGGELLLEIDGERRAFVSGELSCRGLE